MNILIADDEINMTKIISAYLTKEGFNTFIANDGEEALQIFDSNNIQLAILDWMMPKIDGIELCKYIKQNSDAKVMMLTAKSEVDDEVKVLTSGADEYMKKPFDFTVLILRVKKLLDIREITTIKDITINNKLKKVYKNNEVINLTKTEYELLECFIRNIGIILSREKLLNIIWGVEYEGDYRTVDTHIRRLRSKIGEEVITTHRGLGYCMESD